VQLARGWARVRSCLIKELRSIRADPMMLVLVAYRDGWIVISMKNDWERIFGFDAVP
jgi:hypothetical protein